MIDGLVWGGLILSLLSGMILFWNMLEFRTLNRRDGIQAGPVSVLIPARNEADNIATTIEHLLANQGVEFEILVMDDGSTDHTRSIIERYCRIDQRVKLLKAPPLPRNWNGKVHACHQLASHARYPLLLFIDADVTVGQTALQRIAQHMPPSGPDFLSGFPKQLTYSPAERLVIPFIHFILLGYLPVWASRTLRSTKFAAGCGQLIAVKQKAYKLCGGHAAIASSLHDGLDLAKAFRKHNLRTDIFDARDLAQIRMYSNWHEIRAGFDKNATQGMATPLGLPVWTVLLAGGHLLPFAGLAWPGELDETAVACLWTSVLLSVGQRLCLAHRYQQSLLYCFLQPAGIIALLSIQWCAFFEKMVGKPACWRGRYYPR